METNLDTKIIAHSEGGVSQPMEGSTFSAVPPGFEDLKGKKGCSSSSLDKPNPDSTKRKGGASIIKQEEQPVHHNFKDDDVGRQQLYKLSEVLKKLLRESRAHLKSVCKLNLESVVPYKNSIEHVTALLLQQTEGSTIHLKKISLTEKVFDPKSLPTTNPTEHIEWFTKNKKDYIFQLTREDKTNKALHVNSRVEEETNYRKLNFLKNKKEFITELRCASTSNKAFNETPISYVNPNERIVQSVENDKEFIAELKCASTTNKVLNAIPISFVKPNEDIVRSVQNEKEFVAELKGTSSTSKKVFNSTAVSYLNPSEKIIQNQKEFAALLKDVFAAKKALNVTPTSYAKPNERQVVQSVQYEKKPVMIEPKSTCKTSREVDGEPISYMKPDHDMSYSEEIVPPLENQMVVSPNQSSGKKTIKVATERIGWIEVDFKLPSTFDSTGMDLNKLIMPLSGIQDAANLNREFSFAERLVNWFVEVRNRVNGKYDIYYYHTKAPRMFRSCSEVIKFIMYEAYPGRATKIKEGNPDIGNSSEKQGSCSSSSSTIKKRKMNQFVPQAVHDNEATWGKLVDELIMLSGSGNISSGDRKDGKGTGKLLFDEAMNSPSTPRLVAEGNHDGIESAADKMKDEINDPMHDDQTAA